MKIEEVIRELRVNPYKEFNNGIGITLYIDANGDLAHRGICVLEFDRQLLNADWKEVKKPVTFMEAINSGKKIKYSAWEKYKELDDALNYLANEYYSGEVKCIINGKWYIE